MTRHIGLSAYEASTEQGIDGAELDSFILAQTHGKGTPTNMEGLLMSISIMHKAFHHALREEHITKIWFLGRASGIKPARRVMHLNPENFGDEGFRAVQEDMLLTLGTVQGNA